MGSLKVWDGTAWQIASQQGPAGPASLPPGGAMDSILVKNSAAELDARWAPYLAYVSTSPSPATTGAIRLGNPQWVMARNSTNDGNVYVIGLSTTTVYIGYTTGVGVQIGHTNAPYGFGVTPVAKSTGWSVTAGYTALKTLDPNTTTLAALARVVGTLIDTVKAHGMILP